MMKYDIVIIGAGVAGLYAAINLPVSKKVLVINKLRPWECNTFYAQGGVTTARDESDIPVHIRDTIEAGAGLCDEEAVAVLSNSSRDVVSDLIERGFEFDKDDEGRLLYTKEAAHSQDRILHAGGDGTGRHLHHFLLQQNPHPMLADATVIDLLIDDGEACGVVVDYQGERRSIRASQVIIASGGLGSLFEYHTNAFKISGDLQGICLEKGIELENMEMLQFHPTVYVGNNSAQKQLLSEALRGEGAVVEDETGHRFLADYDERAELAPRDIVSRAIYDYTKKTGLQVYLSFEKFDYAYFQHRFPNIHSKLYDLGFDLPKQRVPISPAFHYAIGGIKTNLYGEVESVKGLFAIGEVASTGVHGANRLASNSLLEGLVFAKRAAEKIVTCESTKCPTELPILDAVLELDGDKAKKDELRRIMWENVSIVRTQQGLSEAKEAIEAMLNGEIGRLLRLRLLTAKSIVDSAIQRKTSVGAHYILQEER